MDVGKVFGYRKIIEMLENDKWGARVARVKCVCGREDTVKLAPLLRGKSLRCRSCAALAVAFNRSKATVGTKFNRWTVLEVLGLSRDRYRLVRCKCECGNEGIVRLFTLKNGASTQCRSCASKSCRKRTKRIIKEKVYVCR